MNEMESTIGIDDNEVGESREEIAVADGSQSLEATIEIMEDTNACLNPVHYHAFQNVSFIIQQKKCCGCGQWLQSALFTGGNQTAVVQCLSCKKYAHRSCGLSRTLQFEEICPVNSKHGENQNKLEIEPPDVEEDDEQTKDDDTEEVQDKKETILPLATANLLLSFTKHDPNTDGATNISTSEVSLDDDRSSQCSKANFPFLSAASLFRLRRTASSDQENIPDDTSSPVENDNNELDHSAGTNSPEEHTVEALPTSSSIDQLNNELDCATMTKDTTVSNSHCEEATKALSTLDEIESKQNFDPPQEPQRFQWTSEGPPQHWVDSASDVIPIVLPPNAKEQPADDTIGDKTVDPNEPLHYASQPFSSVSRALQEIIIAHFQPVVEKILSNENNKVVEPSSPDTDGSNIVAEESREVEGTSSLERTPSTVSEAPSDAEVKGLLTEVVPENSDTNGSNRRKLGVAAVAGGVVGGVAGLVFAGPFGGVIGAKAGQTAGLLGVLLEGSFSIGVVASGVAVGRYTGEQLGDKFEAQRVLALGEHGTRRVLLVRPNVTTDPIWEDIYKDARQTQPKASSSLITFGILRDEEALAKRDRYEREADIVRTDEEEIPTADKVLLLVSRILNDRMSLPGHVYRHLLVAFRKRCDERGPLDEIVSIMQSKQEKDPEILVGPPDFLLEPHCARRRDCHAVIKYVTATLQEVRPGFASCPAMTELTATAVESLVFGEVYDLVIDELEAAHGRRDESLLEKIADFERRQVSNETYKSCVSEQALEALHRLPGAHSVHDKLRTIVQFLEKISDFFSSSSSGKKSAIGADSLLKMACQHIIMAKVYGINAQIAFLEEFARDEQLLRGREGYALATFQASLHFLNQSNNFEDDIFASET